MTEDAGVGTPDHVDDTPVPGWIAIGKVKIRRQEVGAAEKRKNKEKDELERRVWTKPGDQTLIRIDGQEEGDQQHQTGYPTMGETGWHSQKVIRLNNLPEAPR